MITSSLHRVLFWFLTISSEAIVCVLVLLLSGTPERSVRSDAVWVRGLPTPDILLPWISFVIAVVVSVVRF